MFLFPGLMELDGARAFPVLQQLHTDLTWFSRCASWTGDVSLDLRTQKEPTLFFYDHTALRECGRYSRRCLTFARCREHARNVNRARVINLRGRTTVLRASPVLHWVFGDPRHTGQSLLQSFQSSMERSYSHRLIHGLQYSMKSLDPRELRRETHCVAHFPLQRPAPALNLGHSTLHWCTNAETWGGHSWLKVNKNASGTHL